MEKRLIPVDKSSPVPISVDIGSKIHVVRGIQVMLDSDLALLYGVEVKVLNQTVKRNEERFPTSFFFQLSVEEVESLRSQFVTSKKNEGRGGRRYLTYVFTEQGVAMLSAVLRSETAVRISIQIMQAFVEMRRFLQNNAQVFTRLESVERRQISFESETGQKFAKLFDALERSEIKPKQGIFFNGQVFDAHTFAGNLIRSAKKSLVLFDNYIDDSVLTLFTKRTSGVSAKIFTKTISKELALDLKKHNEQYPSIDIQEFKDTHDRFLIIDEKEIYHIGASLKDLGKKWFAFSRFESGAVEVLGRVGVGR